MLDVRPALRSVLIAVSLAVVAAAAPAATARPTGPHGRAVPVDVGAAERCSILDPAHCLLPFPSDEYTVADPTSATGRRLHLDPASMPANKAGTPIDPSDINKADGFSPGEQIVVKVPGLDTPEAFARTGAVPVTDMGRTFARSQPIVLIAARTGRRQLIWSELDANAGSPAATTLLIHPGKNLREGGHYIVALRRLRDGAGEIIPAPPAFRALRDRVRTTAPLLERRRGHWEHLFRTLRRSGIRRRSLYLAWDFTVASAGSLSGRMRHIRDDAFAGLGEHDLADLKIDPGARSPHFTVTSAQDLTVAQSPDIARRVRGTVDVPCYLDQIGCPSGSRFHYAAPGDLLPTRIPGNVIHADFVCNIPRASLATPGRPSIYGHGLFGSRDEIVSNGALSVLGNERDVVMCATDEIGMSSQDLANTGVLLTDLSRFPTLADRVQQGMLDELFLGRAMIAADGLVTDPAFRSPAGAPVIDTRRLFYIGGSQGGIIGGALTAVAPDFNRSILVVPGMNYSVLLPRSVDFDPFSAVLYPNYPDPLTRPLILSLIQLLWDRSEGDGYAQHMTVHPYPGTPAHKVLLAEAFGDHQVANVATEVEARTIGASVRAPLLDPGRSPDVVPAYGIPRIARFPFDGPAALFLWDSGPLRTVGGVTLGTNPPPSTNTANRPGVDPHGAGPAESEGSRAAASAFLQQTGGTFLDACPAQTPCHMLGWTGPGR